MRLLHIPQEPSLVSVSLLPGNKMLIFVGGVIVGSVLHFGLSATGTGLPEGRIVFASQDKPSTSIIEQLETAGFVVVFDSSAHE